MLKSQSLVGSFEQTLNMTADISSISNIWKLNGSRSPLRSPMFADTEWEEEASALSQRERESIVIKHVSLPRNRMAADGIFNQEFGSCLDLSNAFAAKRLRFHVNAI